MATVVVDTCVWSFVHKEHRIGKLYEPHLKGQLKVISFMTLAELYRWAEERAWGERKRTKLDERLREYVVYPVNRPLCRQWAATTDEARRNGTPIAVDDAWIAATALLYDIPLVSHNRKHFEVIPGLKLVTEAT